jgi:hypothetical protein
MAMAGIWTEVYYDNVLLSETNPDGGMIPVVRQPRNLSLSAGQPGHTAGGHLQCWAPAISRGG